MLVHRRGHEVGSSQLLMMKSSTREQVLEWSMKPSSRLISTDHLEELVMRLMPICLPLRLQELVVTAGEVRLMLVSDQMAACCPLCAKPSARVHSHYTRTLADLRLSSVARPTAPAGAPVFLPGSGLLTQDLHRTADGARRTLLPADHATARRDADYRMGVGWTSRSAAMCGPRHAGLRVDAVVTFAALFPCSQTHSARAGCG
jgi:hypothetical protein